METPTNKEVVRRKLERDGSVSLGWALDVARPRITRLAAYIKELRDEGVPIETERLTERTGKNTLYKLAKRTLF